RSTSPSSIIRHHAESGQSVQPNYLGDVEFARRQVVNPVSAAGLYDRDRRGGALEEAPMGVDWSRPHVTSAAKPAELESLIEQQAVLFQSMQGWRSHGCSDYNPLRWRLDERLHMPAYMSASNALRELLAFPGWDEERGCATAIPSLRAAGASIRLPIIRRIILSGACAPTERSRRSRCASRSRRGDGGPRRPRTAPTPITSASYTFTTPATSCTITGRIFMDAPRHL